MLSIKNQEVRIKNQAANSFILDSSFAILRLEGAL